MFDKLFGGNKNSITQLNKGYTFEYQKITWEVLDVYEYQWREGDISKEFKVMGGSQTAYIELEEDDGETTCIFSVEIDKDQISPNFTPEDFEGEDILGELDYAGRRYRLEEINEGYYKNLTGMEPSQKLTNYGFYDGEHFVAIAQWDDGTMDYSVGQEIDPTKIKKIKPPHLI